MTNKSELDQIEKGVTQSRSPSLGIPSDPGVLELAAEMKGAELAGEIEGNILPTINARISATAAQSLAATRDEISKSNEIAIAREAANSKRSAYQSFERERVAIRADRGRSDIGKNEAIAAASAKRDAELARIDGVATDHINRFRARYQEPTWKAPSPDVAAEAQLVISRFPLMSVGAFAKEAADVLRRASDPSTPNDTKYRLNQLLVNVYGPLMERRASSPEKFARSLAPLAGKVSESINSHIDAVTGRVAYNEAHGLANRLEQDHRYINATVGPSGNWDDYVLQFACPSLFPK